MPGTTYLVGGAVRDSVMGRASSDRDWVVVGATPAEMRDAGFRAVGAHFPVFIHPETCDEYALARSRQGEAYSVDVTLEEDLSRRDFTMNAMARAADGMLVDPWQGQRDIEAKVLRHVSTDAFVEDPIRVLRLARFAARYPDFQVAPETVALAQSMAGEGKLDHLVAERVWKELARGLMEEVPSRMVEVLREVGALAVVLPELDALFGVPQPPLHHPEVDTGIHVLMVLDAAARAQASLPVRFAALMHDLGKARTPSSQWPKHHGHEALGQAPLRAVCARLKVPSACAAFAELVCVEHGRAHAAMTLTPKSMVKLLMRVGAFRNADRLEAFLLACECDSRGRAGFEARAYPQAERLRLALAAANTVDVKAVVQATPSAAAIPDALYVARVTQVKRALQTAGEGLARCR